MNFLPVWKFFNQIENGWHYLLDLDLLLAKHCKINVALRTVIASFQ